MKNTFNKEKVKKKKVQKEKVQKEKVQKGNYKKEKVKTEPYLDNGYIDLEEQNSDTLIIEGTALIEDESKYVTQELYTGTAFDQKKRKGNLNVKEKTSSLKIEKKWDKVVNCVQFVARLLKSCQRRKFI